MKKLSVIIVAYNAEKYIDKCIQSVLAQNADVEIVAVNDASADDTAGRIGKYGDKIKFINLEKNTGAVADTRNIGLENAAGEYISFLDSDDWYEEGALTKIINCLDTYKPDILKYGYTSVYPNGRRQIPDKTVDKAAFVKKAEFPEQIYPYFIGGIKLNSVCTAAFRKDILKNIRFSRNYLTAEDAAFSLEAYTAAQSVLLLPDRLYCYYQSGNGLTGRAMGILKKYKCNFMLANKMLHLLPEWKMNTLSWKIKTVSRPLRLTLDKLKRMRNTDV